MKAVREIVTYFIGIVFLFSLVINASLHRPRRVRSIIEEDKHDNLVIKNAKKTMSCTQLYCQLINEYHVAANYLYNCKDKHLPISFDVVDQSNISKTTNAYLTEDSMVVSNQETLPYCRPVKKYHVNNEQVILVTEESVRLVEKSKLTSALGSEFFKMYDIPMGIMTHLGWYDDEMDRIRIFSSIRVY